MVAFARVAVTDRNVLGKTVDELNLDDRFGVAVTRVTRGDIEMTAVPGLRLQFGDRIQLVGRDSDLEAERKNFKTACTPPKRRLRIVSWPSFA